MVLPSSREARAEEHVKSAELFQSYLVAHAKDNADIKAKSIEDVQGAGHSEEFYVLVRLVRSYLGNVRFEPLGLVYSLCASGIATLDDIVIDFRRHSNNLWSTHDKALRACLGTLSRKVFIELISELPAEGKSVEALQQMRSAIENERKMTSRCCPSRPRSPSFRLSYTSRAFRYIIAISI